ncbi:hypothetical protein EJ04DRAFT_152504 [Polyplosphaeria fusca]|uniref:Uncharacterized protein n=1 Tax=Polyplosphaeria fusca TaxID=682080 RepID=A0A9P4QJT0_9PLEO|nr:hypothetical protein EJ04DRAFT_152504 [Polyplosphaeria fusca]
MARIASGFGKADAPPQLLPALTMLTLRLLSQPSLQLHFFLTGPLSDRSPALVLHRQATFSIYGKLQDTPSHQAQPSELQAPIHTSLMAAAYQPAHTRAMDRGSLCISSC